MSGQPFLYDLRKKIALKRQQRHDTVLQKFDRLLGSNGEAHPYRLPDEILEVLSADDSFRRGSNGLMAYPSTEFLYRLCSVRTVVNFTNWKDDASGTARDQDIFERLMSDYETKGTWLKLSDYADYGYLMGFFGFTWWTSLDMDNESIVQVVKKLGLTLIGEYKLVLQCPVSHIQVEKLARVPTVLDGFVCEIFHTTRDADSPTAGVTISFEDLTALHEGTEEYVVSALDVSQIRMRPIHINEEMMKDCNRCFDAMRWRLLETYYTNQSLEDESQDNANG